jgi:hypothetical protein
MVAVVQPGAQADRYRAVCAGRDHRANRLAASALAGAVLLPLILGATSPVWYPAFFFGCALLVHELGHQVGARLLGHAPRHLFLAALFDAGPDEEPLSRVRFFCVRMLGALPALLLAQGLLVLPAPLPIAAEWPDWFGLSLLVVSLLALMPVPATDGAEILDVVFLPEAPRLSFRIQLVMLILFWLASAAVMFITFLASLLLIVPAIRAWRRARLRRHLLAGDPPPSIDSPERALQVVSEAGFDELSFGARCRLARDLLARPLRPALPAPPVLALAGAYLLALAAVPGIAVVSYVVRDSALAAGFAR